MFLSLSSLNACPTSSISNVLALANADLVSAGIIAMSGIPRLSSKPFANI